MSEETRREKLMNRLTPIHLYKLTPKSNCGECGFLTCLAYATQVITGEGRSESCPYLDEQTRNSLQPLLAEQHENGIGIKREGFDKALEYLRKEMQRCRLKTVAAGLGADYAQIDGVPTLELVYLGRKIRVSAETIVDLDGREIDPWEKIFIYNYVLGGAAEPSGNWVGMESFPNSISKIRSLRGHCEERLAQAFAGKAERFAQGAAVWGREVTAEVERTDFAAEFQVLPKLAVRVLWWDEDPAEGFASQVKFLFDSRALETLDLESLLFACEQLTERLLVQS